MRRAVPFILHLFPYLVFFAIEFLLWKTNFIDGTWLIGWDSTQPELNFPAHLSRNFGGVWQEYRGLGLLDGMAHMTNLVHWVYIYLLSFIMPLNMVRYAFVFGMHLLGMIGAYVLFRSFFFNKKQISLSTALLGAVFYGLNPFTLQMFYAPLELFVIHYGFLPWLIWSVWRYLATGKKRDLALFGLLNVLALSQNHVPTIFIVYTAILLMIAGVRFLVTDKRRKWGKYLRLGLMFMVIHSFWLMPYLYSVVKNAPTIAAAKMNVLSNKEIVYRNEAFGDTKNLALMKGFSLEFEDWKELSEFGWQMPAWRDHWSTASIEGLMWVMWVLSMVGIVAIIWKRENRWYPFLAVFLMAFLALGSRVPIIGSINHFAQSYIPYFEQVFRFAFTKFGFTYALMYAALVVVAVQWLGGWLKWLTPIVALVLVVAVSTVARPAFQGQFLYDRIQLVVPSTYFDIFRFFSKPEHEGRVTLLPVQSFWGWEHYRWGYRGSGFIWQGIPNPLMHRAFDPWSAYNESFYKQISRAVYEKDVIGFEKILQQYQIRWLLLDESLFVPGGWPEAASIDNLKELISKSALIEEAETFDSLRKVYRVDIESDSFVYAPKTFIPISSSATYAIKDLGFINDGNYIHDDKAIVYPFNSLLREEIKPDISQDGEAYNLVFEQEVNGGQLILPGIEKGTNLTMAATVQYENGLLRVRFPETWEVAVGDEKIQSQQLPILRLELPRKVSKIMIILGNETVTLSEGGSTNINMSMTVGEPIQLLVFEDVPRLWRSLRNEFLDAEANKCWEREQNKGEISVEKRADSLNIRTRDASACISIKIGKPDSRNLAIVKLPFRSFTGARPHFCFVAEGDAYTCLHDDVFYNSFSSSDWTTEERKVRVEPGKQYWLDVVGRPSDVVGAMWDIDYQPPSIELYPLLAEATYGTEVWDALLTKEEIQLPREKTSVNVTITTKPIWADIAKKGRAEADNCDLFDRGSVKKLTSEKNVTYQARNGGAVCDYLSMDTRRVATNQDYLMMVKAYNHSGRGMKVYLFNETTKRNDIETILTQQLTLLPLMKWPTLEPGGYGLTTEVRSFGPELSENEVEEISFLPVPLTSLSQIKVIPLIREGGFGDFLEKTESGAATRNGLEVNKVIKSGTSHYQVNVEGEGLLVLAQGYEDGWIAWGYQKDRSILPVIFRAKPLTHVKANGWANGFIVLPNTNEVRIVYWPQMLAWVGLGVILPLGGLLVMPKMILVKRGNKKRKTFTIKEHI